MASTRVLVAGDLTVDCHIAQSSGDLSGGRACSCAYSQLGGAALSAALIEAAGAGSQLELQVTQPTVPDLATSLTDHALPESYALWSLFPAEKKDVKPAWRVKEFLGVGGRRPGTRVAPKLDPAGNPDIVVLDDADLGFRSDPSSWPLGEGAPPRWIVLKMSAPIARGPLFDHLVERYRERLIVVVAANDLRLTNVHISREISWERTAQDLAWEMTFNPQLNALSSCAFTVTSFPAAGAFLSTRKPGEDRSAPAFELVFAPREVEGMWLALHQGGMIGYSTCLTAAIVRELARDPANADMALAVQAGLSAMRALHLEGYGHPGTNASAADLRFPTARIVSEIERPAHRFARSSVPAPGFAGNSRLWTILHDRHAGGLGPIAETIVRLGPEAVLADIPVGQFGKLLAVDRQEIESYRGIRALVAEYVSQKLARPLSIAVFGPPGSGKSFGVKELAKALLPGEIQDITFNLTLFRSPEDLVHAFHRVRDIGLSGKLPLVFWDEFDMIDRDNRPEWLRHFLAPMQDGLFQEGELSHPIGRSIFVFAGGISKTMAEFCHSDDADRTRLFQQAKGPDFVSRLKGYINVMGPNPQAPGADPYSAIRRAILLHTLLRRDAGHLFEARQGLQIDDGVLRALLQIGEYRHGVRSMESIIAMSSLAGKRRFERSCLPHVPQMSIHVNPVEFQALVQQLELTSEVVERLAESVHEVFCEELKAQGYQWGAETREEARTHSSLRPYAQLPEHEKEQNRANVRDMSRKLAAIGCVMVPARGGETAARMTPGEADKLAELEHQRWMALKLDTGWEWAKDTDKTRKVHKDLRPWKELSQETRNKDRLLVQRIPQVLSKVGYVVVRVVP